jgi:hypothetical protein
MEDEIRKAAEEYTSEYHKKYRHLYTFADCVEYAIKHDRKRRDLEVDLNNLKKKEHTYIDLSEARDIAMNSIPKSEPPPFYDDELNEDTDDLESMLVELADMNGVSKPVWRVSLSGQLHYRYHTVVEDPTIWYDTPTEAVRARLDEMKGKGDA